MRGIKEGKTSAGKLEFHSAGKTRGQLRHTRSGKCGNERTILVIGKWKEEH